MNADMSGIVIGFPNTVGDPGRYDLRDQRTYFHQFDGGASYVFQLALENVLGGDLLAYNEQCNEYMDGHYHELFFDNSMTLVNYHKNKKEFNRRILDIYRYAKTSMSVLGKHDFTEVRRFYTDKILDSSLFIIK